MRLKEFYHQDYIDNYNSNIFNYEANISLISKVIHETGVAILREAIPKNICGVIRRNANNFDHLKIEPGYLLLWEALSNRDYFLAPIFSSLIKSKLLQLMMKICKSSQIVIPLSHFVLRSSYDDPHQDTSMFYHLTKKFHQDFYVVNRYVPYNLWIALEDMTPGKKSSLAFLVNQTVDDKDLNDRKLWLPSFDIGDVALFTNLTSHGTTLYNTGTQRWSLELRYGQNIPSEMSENESYLIIESKGARIIGLDFAPLLKEQLQSLIN